MNKQTFCQTVYVADYTNYNAEHKDSPSPYGGVVITDSPSSLIPCFVLRDNNNIPFEAINIEENPGLLKRENKTLASQCECIFNAVRNDKGKPWMMFLELKYCLPKNIARNIAMALEQLKKTYSFLCNEKNFFIPGSVKPYFVVSIPSCESMAPFDDFNLSQDDLLTIKENYGGAQVYYTNAVEVQTTRHLALTP